MAPNSHKKTHSADEEDIQAYIPDYLKHVVLPYHSDFCQTPCFHPRLIVQLMAEGFLPIATQGVLLPKLHQERCVISLPHHLHIKKSVGKKSKKFSLSINLCPNQVVQGCHDQHSNCWLLPPLVAAFTAILAAGGADAVINDKQKTSATVRMYSIELWNIETGTLAAGELGYTVGSIFTSLTGFSREDSAGSVQLAALGALLSICGFTTWDLGMAMDYKIELGAQLLPRADFVEEVHRVRSSYSHLVLPTDGSCVNCKTILDRLSTTSLTSINTNTVKKLTNLETSQTDKKPQMNAKQKLT